MFHEIAAGGMATVHLGRLLGPVGFSKTVAIKRLHGNLARDPEFVSMFLDEARVAARIQHPNVVSTLDVASMDGEVFLVLDYVQGESLSRLLKAMRGREARPDLRIVSSVLVNALHGLHAAHEATDEQGRPLEIVHRDVSPQNILVGVDGVARVLDFGVAKAAGRLQSTRDGQLKGKLSYMAPEQVRGEAVDCRTDIYSASVVLWEGLTGRRLIQSQNEAQVLHEVLSAAFPAPSQVAPWIPPHVDAVVMRGLAPSPQQRFATAREMAIAVERAIGVASPYEVGEWVRAWAQDALTLRAARVREMESTSAVHMVPSGLPRPAAPAVVDGTASGISLVTSPSSISEISALSHPSQVSQASQLSYPSQVSHASQVSQASQVSYPSHASQVSPLAFPPVPASNGSSTRLVLIVVGVTAALGLLGIALLVLLRTRDPGAPAAVVPVTPRAAAAPALPESTPEPAATTPAPAEVTPAAEPEPPQAKVLAPEPPKSGKQPAATTQAKPTASPTTKPPAAAKPGACDNPFYVDSSGIKHVKPECM
ncbi:MAG: protein kinase [Polyangiaceae bacterium]|nr:protein kinase [Polyangiaceae bacterium]